MKTIKVIDLLNKIANGEEVPKLIKYHNVYFRWYERLDDKYNYKVFNIEKNKYGYDYLDKIYTITSMLNDEVEIIEEKKLPKKIECKGSYNSKKGFEDFNDNEKILVDKINDLLDYLESKEKGE